MTTTPFGPAIATYPTKDAFYAANPAAAIDWDWQGHGGSAPLGSDLPLGNDRWMVTVCHPGNQEQGAGPVVAFDRETGDVHLISTSMTFADAEKKFRN